MQIASQQAIANNPSYVWTALPAGSELMYSQPAPAQAFQTEIDSTFVDGTPVEVIAICNFAGLFFIYVKDFIYCLAMKIDSVNDTVFS